MSNAHVVNIGPTPPSDEYLYHRSSASQSYSHTSEMENLKRRQKPSSAYADSYESMPADEFVQSYSDNDNEKLYKPPPRLSSNKVNLA